MDALEKRHRLALYAFMIVNALTATIEFSTSGTVCWIATITNIASIFVYIAIDRIIERRWGKSLKNGDIESRKCPARIPWAVPENGTPPAFRKTNSNCDS